MKKLFIFLASWMIILQTYSQVGVGTNSPDPSSVIDISSTTKGVLFPRLTASQRLGIASPANGLMVFDLDSNGLFIYEANLWTKISSSASTSTNNTFNIEYPDGITNITTILQDISSGKTYTVPADSNLYIQACIGNFSIGNYTFSASYHGRLIAKSGDVITGVNGGSFISGFLVPATVTPITINLSTGNYTVPAGKTFVLIESENNVFGSDVTANDLPLNPGGSTTWAYPPIPFSTGTVLSSTMGCVINGYLK